MGDEPPPNTASFQRLKPLPAKGRKRRTRKGIVPESTPPQNNETSFQQAVGTTESCYTPGGRSRSKPVEGFLSPEDQIRDISSIHNGTCGLDNVRDGQPIKESVQGGDHNISCEIHNGDGVVGIPRAGFNSSISSNHEQVASIRIDSIKDVFPENKNEASQVVKDHQPGPERAGHSPRAAQDTKVESASEEEEDVPVHSRQISEVCSSSCSFLMHAQNRFVFLTWMGPQTYSNISTREWKAPVVSWREKCFKEVKKDRPSRPSFSCLWRWNALKKHRSQVVSELREYSRTQQVNLVTDRAPENRKVCNFPPIYTWR
jgi:hypothetical protein